MRAYLVVAAVACLAAAGCKQANPLHCSEADTSCGEGRTCNVVTNECELVVVDAGPPQPDAPACSDDQECIETTRPICGGADLCRACQSGTECAAKDPATPRCAGDGSCVECTESSECAEALAPICRADACEPCASNAECADRDAALGQCAADGQCVECTDHDQCASGVCDRGPGTCIAEAAAVYVDGEDGVDTPACGTRASPCETVGIGLLRVEDGRRHVLVAPGDYVEDTIISADTVLVAPSAILRTSSLNQAAVIVNNGASVAIDGAQLLSAGGATDAHGLSCTSAGASVALTRVTIRNTESSSVFATNGCAVTLVEATVEDSAAFGIFSSGGSVELRRSLVRRNERGGVSVQNGAFTIVNNFIVSNGAAGADGSEFGGVKIDNSFAESPQEFEFNTVANNASAEDGLATGVRCSTATTPTVRNNIVFDGVGASAVSGNCPWTFSNVEGGITGAGNINAAPMFLSPADGDFHLQTASPAVDVADPESEVVVDVDGDARPQGTGRDMGADEVVE